MRIVAPDLLPYVRACQPAQMFDVRARGTGAGCDDGGGNLVYAATKHEAERLVEAGHCEGVANRHGFKYLHLVVSTPVAMAKLRRTLAQGGRTVSEACQLTYKTNIPGGGIVYSHFTSRIAAYAPAMRATVT